MPGTDISAIKAVRGSKDKTANATTVSTRAILTDAAYLTAIYCLWKILLLAIVALSPGIGYDTSTDLFFKQEDRPRHSGVAGLSYHLSLRLTRWDGIYFSSFAEHGYVLEQQWAFSWMFAKTSAWLASVLPLPLSLPLAARQALTGCVQSLVSHLAAAILLYYLTLTLLPTAAHRKRQIALTTAYLHVISPAGVFLMAPYGEAVFAMFNIAGMLSYAQAVDRRLSNHPASHMAYSILAGTLFGIATTIRSNGILNGLIFAWDAAGLALNIVFGARTLANLQRLITAVLAGIMVAIGFAAPQYIAYQQYCSAELTRPWCNKPIPSIYSWVQAHYWEVGFLKYWTLPNAPLFVLAAPMLLLVLNTGYAALHHARSLTLAINGEERPFQEKQPEYRHQKAVFVHTLERFALPQIVLALLAATSFHVQIINRISSGYPLWYLVLAVAIDDRSPRLECGHARSAHYYPFRWLRGKLPMRIVQSFVVYAMVQGGLYASFLPPA